MTSFILRLLLFLSSLLLVVEAAQCNRDNCLRALAATPTKASSFCASYTKTPNTVTPIPTYGAACSSNPSRVSSACSCVVTPPPTCVPTPIIKGTVGNGNFENLPPPESAVFNIQPPWYYSREENGFGEYKSEPVGADYGAVAASVTAPPSSHPFHDICANNRQTAHSVLMVKTQVSSLELL